MLQYKQVAMEDYSFIYSWKEKCELKDKVNDIATLQSTIVWLKHQSKKGTNNKDRIIDELGSEVSIIREEF